MYNIPRSLDRKVKLSLFCTGHFLFHTNRHESNKRSSIRANVSDLIVRRNLSDLIPGKWGPKYKFYVSKPKFAHWESETISNFEDRRFTLYLIYMLH